MLRDAFFTVYTKFKLHFYQEIFSRFQDREASLTTVETFCMEAIQALGSPTVNEFATFMRISPPNAAYKVNSLIRKGYIRKVQSPDDRREYHLEITGSISATTTSAAPIWWRSWSASPAGSPLRSVPVWRRCSPSSARS